MLKQWRETRSNDDNAPNTLCTYRKHHTFWLAIKTKYFGFSVRNNKKKNEDYANILMEKLQTSCALFLDSLPRNHFERGKKNVAKKHKSVRWNWHTKRNVRVKFVRCARCLLLLGVLSYMCFKVVRKHGLHRRRRQVTPCYLIFVFIYDFLRWTSSIVWHSHLNRRIFVVVVFFSLCSFRFECHLNGHCLRCFSGKRREKNNRKNRNEKVVYRCSPSKSFVIIYVDIFFYFFAYCSFHNTNSFLILIHSLRALSAGSLLLKHHPSCFFFPTVVANRTFRFVFFSFFKSSITFHVVIWYRFFFKMSFGTFYVRPQCSMEMVLLHICTHFPDFNGTLCAHCVLTFMCMCTKKRPTPFKLKWKSLPYRWFMIKILRNLSFICFRNVAAICLQSSLFKRTIHWSDSFDVYSLFSVFSFLFINLFIFFSAASPCARFEYRYGAGATERCTRSFMLMLFCIIFCTFISIEWHVIQLWGTLNKRKSINHTSF